MMSSSFSTRRQVLVALMKLLVLIGLIFVSIPFLSSFSSSSIDEKQESIDNSVVTLPVTELVPGKIKKLPWAGGVFWVYTRTKNDIAAIQQFESKLRDKDSNLSDQPENLKTSFRSIDKNYFVFIPLENKRRCQVSINSGDEPGLFIEPCFSARYDSAGRIFSNSGHKEQLNLAVPEHIIEDGILKIAAWIPKL